MTSEPPAEDALRAAVTIDSTSVDSTSVESTEGSTSGAVSAARTTTDRLRADMVRGSLWTLLSVAVSMPVAFVANAVIVRSLGPDGYGHFALYVAAYIIVLTVANAGVNDATSQWIAAAHATGDRTGVDLELARRCTGFHLLVKAPALVVLSVVLLHDAGWLWLMIAIVANVVAMALDTATVVLVSTARNVRLAQVTLAMTLATQSATAVAAAAGHDAAASWSVRCAGLMLGPVLSMAFVGAKWRPGVLRPLWPLWSTGRTKRAGYPAGFTSYAFAAWSGAVVGTLLYDRTEIFVLQWQADFTAVAFFAIATTLANQLTVPMDSLMAPLTPVSAGLVAAEPDRATSMLGRALRVTAITGAATCAIVVPMLTGLLVPIFGADYRSVSTALLVLGISSVLASITSPLRAFVLALRLTGALARINAVCLVADAALALTLIPRFELGGAVAALVVGQVLSVLLLARLVCVRLQQTPRSLLAGVRVMALAVPLTVLGWAVAVASGTRGWDAFGTVAGAAVGVVGLILVFRLVPSLRLQDRDVQVIVEGLPARLAQPFLGVARRLRIVG